jgi:polyhydroxyalkanoate synthesis regulator phasin
MAGDNAQELVLKITGDASSGKAASAALLKGMQEAGKAASDSGKLIAGMSDAGRQAVLSMAQVTDAVKNAERSTTSWASQLNSLGGIFGVTLSAAGLVGFANELLRTGDELVRVADRTGLTTVEVQKLQFIAEQSGNSIDDLTGAIGKLQKNLTLGDEGAVKAVAQLGLNLNALKAASPYDEMAQIATAIEKVDDPAQRATLAIQLFGKSGAAILPTLVSQFKALGDSAPAMSDKTVRALDAAGDSLNKFGKYIKVLAAESYNLGGQIFDRLTASAYDGAAAILRAVATFGEIEKHIPGVTTVFDKLGISTEAIRRQAQEYTDTGKLLVSHLGDEQTAIRKTATGFVDFEPPVKKATKAVKEHAAAIIGLGDAEKFIEEVLKRQAEAFAHYYERLEQIIPATREWWALLPQVDGEIQVLASHSIPQATGAVTDLGSGVEHLGGQLQQFWQDSAASPFKDAFVKSLHDIPGMITQALTGGGGLSGAFSAIGTQMGGILAGKIGSAISGHMGGGAFAAAGGEEAGGGAASGILGMFGGGAGLAASLASSAATMGISVGVQALMHFASKIGKPSKDELAARETFAKQGFSDVDDFIAGIQKRAAGTALGGEELRQAIAKVLDATHISASAEKTAIDELNTKLTDAETKAQGVADAIAKANAKPDFEGLTQKAAAFGVSLDALGPKFQQASISKTAAEYIQTFQDLKDAGADVGGVLSGMSDEFSKLVDDSIKFGTTLPEGMRDLIQELIRAGKLTDENGQAITDITTIKFDGSPTDQGLSTMQGDLQKATDQAVGPGGFEEAIEKIGQTIRDQIPINPYGQWQIPAQEMPSMPAYGGPQAAGGLYHVTRPTYFMAGEKPGGEDVAFSGVGRGFGGMGGLEVHVHVAGSVWSGRELGKEVHDQLSDLLRDRYQLRAG